MATQSLKSNNRVGPSAWPIGPPVLCLLLAGASILAPGGCARKAPPLARISGNVTFEGEPIAKGTVVFHNDERGIHMTAGVMEGKYEVITAKGAGLPPGPYRIAITPPRIDHPVGPILAPPKPIAYPDIPARYRDARTSGFTVDLQEGENQADFPMTK